MLAHAHNPYVFTFFFLSLFLHFCCVEFACLFTNFTFNKRWHHFLWNKISAPKIEKAAAKHITVIWTQKKKQSKPSTTCTQTLRNRKKDEWCTKYAK